MGLACGLGHILALALSTQFTTKMPLRYPYDITFAATASFIIHYSSLWHTVPPSDLAILY